MKRTFFVTAAIFCFFMSFACNSSQAETSEIPKSMMAAMKDSVTEIRVYIMSPDYGIQDWDLNILKGGQVPSNWEYYALDIFSIPVSNREIGSEGEIHVPPGDYKILFVALGGAEWSAPIFYFTSNTIFSMKEGEVTAPDVGWVGLGLWINIGLVNENGNALSLGTIGSSKLAVISDGQEITASINFWESWEWNPQNGEDELSVVADVFLPYGADSVSVIVNTDSPLLAPISWDEVVDGKITVNPKPQLSGAILRPNFIWPED